jgi:hypothetical protein
MRTLDTQAAQESALTLTGIVAARNLPVTASPAVVPPAGEDAAGHEIAAAVVLARAGLTNWPRNHRLLTWSPWVLAVLFAISALGNVASESYWENYLLGPAAVVLAGLCVIVARAPLKFSRS